MRQHAGLARGFTLIELMLVLVVVSIMASLLVVSINDNPAKQLDREAVRLRSVLEMASEEALMQGLEISLAVTTSSEGVDGYQFLLLDPDELTWQASDDKPFSFHPLHADISMQVVPADGLTQSSRFDRQMDQLQRLKSEERWTPLLLFLSSGENTPFIITLEHGAFDGQVSIRSDGLSGVNIK
jgi:general secretion pathway protein H